MRSTVPAEIHHHTRRGVLGLVALAGAPHSQAHSSPIPPDMNQSPSPHPGALAGKQKAIGPLAAAAAVGDMARLPDALHRGLDAGLSTGDLKEILVQLYAYAGFPRSLNALAELMKVAGDRRRRGLQDAPGAEPGPVPTGLALLEAGTANQTRLSGGPVQGPVFDFAPAIDQYLKTHLFGDIFARDNLDWQSRELATVAALASMAGVDAQLAAHVRISLNVGITPDQLREFAYELGRQGFVDADDRISRALQTHLSGQGR